MSSDNQTTNGGVSGEPRSGVSESLGRPRYHVVAQRGWMNDPCAPGFIPSTSEFTLMYQWNPHSHLWDNISWGGVKSKDLVRWKYSSEETIFTPDKPYDQKGIFTGCLYPTSPTGDEGLSIFYTSVPHIPIHWSWPHHRGAEGVALATSEDGGKTWIKHASNPIVRAEPEHLLVTGYRDPSVIPWASMDAALNRSSPGLYALLSGGVQGSPDQGPRLFLYDVNPKDMTQWTYLQTLGDHIPRNLTPHRWTGDLGTNWECASVFALKDEQSGESRDVCVFGVEGGSLREHVERYRAEEGRGRHERAARYCHWFFTSLEERNKGEGKEVEMKWKTGGLVDWAEFYALSTFAHPDGRRIGWGWFVELDLPDDVAADKGWTGCLGLPREYSLQVTDGVDGASVSPLQGIGSFDVIPSKDGSRVVTLASQPLAELVELRQRLLFSSVPDNQAMPSSYEIHLIVDLATDASIRLSIRHSLNQSITTDITFSPSTEQLVINRAQSSAHSGINSQNEIAPHTLLSFVNGTREPLDLRVFVDADTIEVFANGRTALATRAYAPQTANLVSLHVEGQREVKRCDAWEMGSIGLVE